MKFNCGPTYQEKYAAGQARLKDWHPFFCLKPRRMTATHECRWLELVERRGKWVLSQFRRPRGFYQGGWWEWEYRAKS